MKSLLIILTILISINACAQKDTSNIKSLLIQQLKYTHTEQDWFVPINIAIEGLTTEQSNWRDSTENHSIAQLVSHLVFWNERVLRTFVGETLPEFKEENKVTFNKYSAIEWSQSSKKLDSIQTAWKDIVEGAPEEQLNKWSTEIANMCSHNAYHTGQIMYIRKRNGWWKSN